MSKRHYFDKFSKITKRWGFSNPQRSLIFYFGDLKLRDSAKLYDVIVITSPKNITKLTYKIFPFQAPPNHNFWLS